jgi:PEP-CTERM motif
MSVRGFHFLPVVFAFACPLLVEADPITVSYNISIEQRCAFSTNECTPFAAEFPLTMTFDDRITSQSFTPTSQLQFYGPPSFSEVPLPRRPVSPGARESRTTLDTRFLNDDASLPAWRRVASAQEFFQLSTGESELSWTLQLFSSVDTDMQPPLDPASFAAFLGTGEGNLFRYVFGGRSLVTPGEFTSDSFAFNGRINLASGPAPVPEPGTVLLLSAAGLAGLAQRKRRRT